MFPLSGAAMKKIVVIGAGINGLILANYLCRQGFAVTLLEKKDSVGGACTQDSVSIAGKNYTYSNGASAFGFMQDFVFAETGLAEKLSVFSPAHAEIIYRSSQNEPCIFYDDADLLRKELKSKWGEDGDVQGFLRDRKFVRDFLVDQFRKACVPTIAQAEKELGQELVKRWITGSAHDLLSHYFTSAMAKMFFAIEVTESGPVDLDSPYSAFNVVLMNTGGLFDGRWGFVKGGIGQVCRQLAEINVELGVRIVTGVNISSVLPTDKQVFYSVDGTDHNAEADLVVFATDPLTAARLLKDEEMEKQVLGKKLLGTSGKLVMFFAKPVKWKDTTGCEDFATAFRFIIATESLEQFTASAKLVVEGRQDFSPAYFEIYCEGAGRNHLGEELDYDLVAVFLKNMALDKLGSQLPEVKAQVEALVLEKIENSADLVGSLLFTPKDIQQTFFMPAGNIDHVELCEGQNFFARNYSPDPDTSFYQFGQHENVFYCGAGSYPCGSVAGTAGYICAQQIIRKLAPQAALAR